MLKKTPEMLGIESEHPAGHLKVKFRQLCRSFIGGFFLLCGSPHPLSRENPENRPERFPFVCKNFFAPYSPINQKICSEEEKEGEKAIVKCYTVQAKAINVESSTVALYNVTLEFHTLRELVCRVKFGKKGLKL